MYSCRHSFLHFLNDSFFSEIQLLLSLQCSVRKSIQIPTPYFLIGLDSFLCNIQWSKLTFKVDFSLVYSWAESFVLFFYVSNLLKLTPLHFFFGFFPKTSRWRWNSGWRNRWWNKLALFWSANIEIKSWNVISEGAFTFLHLLQIDVPTYYESLT